MDCRYYPSCAKLSRVITKSKLRMFLRSTV